MRIHGNAFECTVPEHWSELAAPDRVHAASPFPVEGVAPQMIMREFRVTPGPEILAAAAQSALRVVDDSLVIQVEPITRHGAERRRIWALTPVISEEDGHTVTALTIRDLVVMEGLLADVTLTLPLAHWKPQDSHLTILDSLRLRPVAERLTPNGTASFATPTLDDVATRRDGVPREDLSVVPRPAPALPHGPAELSSAAAAVLVNNIQVRGDHVPAGEVGDELVAAHLLRADRHLSVTGHHYAHHVLNGTGWRISMHPGDRQIRFWTTEDTTALLVPHPEEEGRSLLGWCTTDDLFRLLLTWVAPAPAWPRDLTLRLGRRRLRAKVEQGRNPGRNHAGDTAEFLRHDWTSLSLTDMWAAPVLEWINSTGGGSAVVHIDRPLRRVSLRQDPEEPLWQQLLTTLRTHKPTHLRSRRARG